VALPVLSEDVAGLVRNGTSFRCDTGRAKAITTQGEMEMSADSEAVKMMLRSRDSRIRELEHALRRLISEAHNDGQHIWIDAGAWVEITKDENIVSKAK
jgi:chromosomal replication initiation ATPase DnaA